MRPHCRVLAVLLLFALLAAPALATIPTQTVWEIRPTVGASTNGGGFAQGATGTDMSVFNNKNAAGCSSCQSATINISTADSVAVGTTSITSATGNFSAALVGNVVYFSGGTGSIAAVRRQVVTFTNSTTIVLDASVAASTGMTMNIGGALASFADIAVSGSAMTAGNIVWEKATGIDAITASTAICCNQTPATTVPFNQLIGYNTTRGDCDNLATPCAARPTLQATTNAGITLIGGTNAGWNVRNIILDCNNLASCNGNGGGYYMNYSNVWIKKFAGTGFTAAGGSNSSTISDSEISNGQSGCSGGIVLTTDWSYVLRNWVHDSPCDGIHVAHGHVEGNIVSTLTATSDGISCINGDRGCTIIHNTIYSVTRDGISLFGNELGIGATVRCNVIDSPGRYGLQGATAAGWPAQAAWDGNAYRNSTTANRHNVDDAGTVNAVNAANGYTNYLDVALAGGSPFTNAGGNDFTLNSTAGAGLALIGTCSNKVGGGAITQTNYEDFGAMQTRYGTGSAGGGGAFAYVQ